MRKRLFSLLFFISFCSFFWLACTNPANNKNPDGGTGKAECQQANQCWEKRCPSGSSTEQQECLSKYLSPDDKKGPQYVSCQQNKCVEVDRSQLGSAEVNVTMPVGLDSQHLGYLLAFVYGQKDLNGKPITCERLKMEKNPASRILARYYPPRDWSTIYGIPNAQAGSSYRLLMDGKTIPAGKRTLLVLGFCRTDDGRPEFTEETGFKITWQACKENVEIKPGESNDISIKLPISETCD